MRADSDIKRDVEEELKWEPNVDATDIAVAVKNGVVTLTGLVLRASRPSREKPGRRAGYRTSRR
jgi:osmotically-inducible protein OsmY